MSGTDERDVVLVPAKLWQAFREWLDAGSNGMFCFNADHGRVRSADLRSHLTNGPPSS